MRFFQFQFNILKPTQHDLDTNPNDITTAPSFKKTSLSNLLTPFRTKSFKIFVFQNHKFTSPLFCYSHYSQNDL